MKFTPVLFAGLAAAAPFIPSQAGSPTHYHPSSTQINATAPDPSTYENVDISSFSVREQMNVNTAQVVGIESVSFTLNSNVTCSAQSPGTLGVVFPCGSTSYSFGLVNGTTSQFGLRIYKATSQFAGWFGTGDVQTYCHTGGGSAEICTQVQPTTIVINPMTGIGK